MFTKVCLWRNVALQFYIYNSFGFFKLFMHSKFFWQRKRNLRVQSRFPLYDKLFIRTICKCMYCGNCKYCKLMCRFCCTFYNLVLSFLWKCKKLSNSYIISISGSLDNFVHFLLMEETTTFLLMEETTTFPRFPSSSNMD